MKKLLFALAFVAGLMACGGTEEDYELDESSLTTEQISEMNRQRVCVSQFTRCMGGCGSDASCGNRCNVQLDGCMGG